MSIGELSRVTGVPVRTIRFYCDEGILRATRSTGGHRMFDPATAPDRLRTVRRLRALGLGLTAIVDVLADTTTIGDAVTVEKALLDEQVASLNWRRARLTAVEAAPADRRMARVALLEHVQDGNRVHDELVRYWRGLLVALPAPLFDGFVEMNIPRPPREPAADQVVAYAELALAVTDPALRAAMSRQLYRARPADILDRRALVTGVAEACSLADPSVAADVDPHPGPALDRFVTAHASARRERDSTGFRRRLLDAAATDRRVLRYWDLTGEIHTAPTSGAALHWLHRALERATTTPD
ncbi:MerR family transcriptional regulator [Nocardia takedensis]